MIQTSKFASQRIEVPEATNEMIEQTIDKREEDVLKPINTESSANPIAGHFEYGTEIEVKSIVGISRGQKKR
jgi:hypothetical protein